MPAGLPNIQGKLGLAGAPISNPDDRNIYPSFLEGVFTELEGGHRHWAGGHQTNSYADDAAVFNAAASSEIYGNSDTVQPAAICLIPQIKF